MNRESIFKQIISITLIFTFASFLILFDCNMVLYASGPDKKDVSMTIKEGINHYKGGRYEEALDKLTSAKSLAPNNSEVSLYLGLTYLRLNDTARAIEEWQRYTLLESADTRLSGEIRQHLTLLIREDAKRLAQEAVEKEKAIGLLKPKENTIAVTYFNNLGSKELDPLRKGLTAMIITDLSHVKGLNVVERMRIQAMLDELKLSESGLVNKRSAPRVGKLLMAAKITTGSYLDLKKERIKIDSTLIHTETSRFLGNQGAEGPMSELYKVEKILAFEILQGLGYSEDKLDPALLKEINTIHTKSYKAFVHYSQGLDYTDEELYRAAAKEYQKALEYDPDFELAKKALKATPLLLIGTGAIIASVESSITTYGAAGGTTAAATGGAIGKGTIAAIVAGAAAIGGGLAVLVSGGGSGNDGSLSNVTIDYQTDIITIDPDAEQQQVQLNASGGTPPYQWSSSDLRVGDVQPNQANTAEALFVRGPNNIAGVTTITVTDSTGNSASFDMTVA